ncbi:iron ABC transporter permease [Vibrio cholerae]|uniref:FecCD family ABC transporter permease n=1 Tax=Vibrio paracholerae TaxID=650003 RepID=UPI0019D1E89A|nr:iron ABC transporter permease [Vibrio paracholerae]EGR5063426.1 iron ABC transporter permease [Vibrio cholerae]MBN7286632.1 iron chelate uptake ABC transporter family permease subunit [Vibrio paracholerae]
MSTLVWQKTASLVIQSLRGLLLAVGILLAAILLAVTVGESSISVQTVYQTLANNLLGAQYAVDLIDAGILWEYRLSRAVIASCCGAALAVSGVILQSLLRNVLVDPYILGISAGASAGAVAVTIVGIGAGVLSMSAGAFLGALLSFGLVLALSRLTGQIILAGIAGAQLFHALSALMITKSANAEAARGIMFWLLGNLSGVRWADASLAVPIALIGLAIALYHARALDAFTFGAESAASLGIPVKRVRLILILVTASMTAVMVSMVGSIGFVGLVIPHAARYIVGVRHAVLLPVSALMGAVFLIMSDILSRIVVPGQVLPIGVVTALIGAPAFALILIRGAKHK